MSFYQKLESIQHNPFLVITGAIRGISKKIYQKLDIESLQLQR